MIRINQLKIPIFEVGTDPEEERLLLRKKAAALLKVKETGIRKLRILRRSTDARDKSRILFVYLLEVRLSDSLSGPNRKTEEQFVRKLRNKNITLEEQIPLQIPTLKPEQAAAYESRFGRPIVIGSGPCGLFAAHTLALSGLHPLVIERGEAVEKRIRSTEQFFETGRLNPESNVQFGEGGAGTFSDGKLNTSVKGQESYIRYVLHTFADMGACKDILYEQKPHIGTDVLVTVVQRLREKIRSLGGEFLFETRLSDLVIREGVLSGLLLDAPKDHGLRKKYESLLGQKAEDGQFCISASRCILAIGHSARDTISMLYDHSLAMEQKPFAMGLRVQHPQSLINEALYGGDRLPEKEAILGPAPYKLTHKTKDGRSIYSFCMCPGGYVVNSSSEEGRLCINGMSDQKRDGKNANAALIVNIRKEDFPSEHPLSGIAFQRDLEEKAYRLCGGAIPCETYGDFREHRTADFSVSGYEPAFRGYFSYGDIRSILPDFMQEAVLEGMEAFSRTIPGFNSPDALLSAIEARTSSPVRILRNEEGVSSLPGLYPAGEGAGYAGGITSAAIDGIRTALCLIREAASDKTATEEKEA